MAGCRLTRNLPRNRAADLSLSVFEKLDKCGYEVSVDHLIVDSFRNLARVSLACVSGVSCSYLLESVCNHVAHPPALVLEQTAQGREQDAVARLLLLGYRLRDRDEDVDGQQPDAVLVVCGKVLEKGNHLVDDNRSGHGLDELGEVICSLSSDHGCVVVYELAVVLAESLLRRGSGAGIWCLIKTGRRDLRGEPVCLG